MKSILLSIKPYWVEKILNNEKTIEVRKKFPRDYKGWVYIYCSKSKPFLYKEENGSFELQNKKNYFKPLYNGKVVARFWCDVEKISKYRINFSTENYDEYIGTDTLDEYDLCNKSFLTPEQLDDYLITCNGYALYISKLEIFDTPRELGIYYRELSKAPQNYCYIDERN